MKIGILVDGLGKKYKRTGISNYTHEIIRYLCNLDTQDDYYLFSNDNICIDYSLPSNFHLVIDRSTQRALWQVFRVGSLAKRYSIDVLWSPTHVLPLWGKKYCKYAMTVHDLANLKFKRIDQDHIKGKVLNLVLKFSVKKADLILAVSKATKQDVIDLCSKNEEAIQVIYEGSVMCEACETVLSDSEKVLSKFHILDKYFLFVSTLQPRKNVNTIVQAYNEYRNRTKDSCQLVLAGGDGWGIEELNKLISESPYSDSIIRTGYISENEKICLYSKCICFVYPSLYEGFGIPVLEAMKFGKPVITANVSSLPEVGGDVAFYIQDPRDSQALSELMETVVDLPEEEVNVIKKRSIAREETFSWKKCAIETIEAIKSMRI